MKFQVLFVSSLLCMTSISAFAARAELSDTQRACLDSKLGKPGSGARPSHAQMEQALSDCGVQKEAKADDSHRPQLSDEQKACLDGILGKPSESNRPSKEQFESALSQCSASASQ